MKQHVVEFDPVYLVSGDEVRMASGGFPWTMILITAFAVVVFVSMFVWFRMRSRARRSNPRFAWIELANSVGLTKSEQAALETACSIAAIDPCVIALCPSKIDRVMLQSAGRTDRAAAWSAIGKLHPSWVPPEMQVREPNPRHRSRQFTA